MSGDCRKNDTNNICCCCWVYYPPRGKKSLTNVSENIESLMKTYVYVGYSTKNDVFPSKICANCSRNLYFLSKEKDNRGSWGELISKV